MIFLECIGSRACLSARLIKLSPVKLRFYGTFLLCQCENRFDKGSRDQRKNLRDLLVKYKFQLV